MMLVDANILIYAYDSSSPLHTAAKQWIEKTLSETEPIRLAWMTILAFLRITTHRKIFANPYSISEAAALVNDWLAQPCMGILQPTARHWPILTELLQDGQATGPLIMDTHLAALAIEHGAMLCSTDKDFTRFGKLKLANPLAATG